MPLLVNIRRRDFSKPAGYGSILKEAHRNYQDFVENVDVKAREVALYIARDMSGMSCKDLAEYFGGVSGALIIIMHNRIAALGNSPLTGCCPNRTLVANLALAVLISVVFLLANKHKATNNG